MVRIFSRRLFNIKPNFKKITFLIFFIIFIILFLKSFKSSTFQATEQKTIHLECKDHEFRLNNKYSCKREKQCKTSSKCQDNHYALLILTKQSNELPVIVESVKLNYEKLYFSNLSYMKISDAYFSRFSLFIVESILELQNFNLLYAALFEHCRINSKSIIATAYSLENDLKSALVSPSLKYYKSDYVNNIYTTNSSLLYLTKHNKVIEGVFQTKKWSFLVPTGEGFDILAFGRHKADSLNDDISFIDSVSDRDYSYKPIIVRDFGLSDGVNKFIFTSDMSHWLSIIVLLDILNNLCHFHLDLTRHIQVDIDDIFVGKSGQRMILGDVQQLLFHQHKWSSIFVKDFQFYLGYSGYYYQSGNTFEDEADALLISEKHQFKWFPHMWSHKKPHTMNASKLLLEIQKNEDFADKKQLDRSINYAVAPFHSGVYPTYDLLYKFWRKYGNISVTSTEEYPKLNPYRNRKGFIYRNISVLPRQTCGIYTHTLYLNKYPKGHVILDQSILGGSLFFTVIFNYINIFMTHFSNYGADRLGIYTFDGLFSFISCYTNLKLSQIPPTKLVELYFKKYPKEIKPEWYNPCNYKRHSNLIPITYGCELLPKIVILGPQKTGTTALVKFLNLHPELQSNSNLKDTFEEPQFFSGHNYNNGVEWYLSLFKNPERNGNLTYFEKSATYFDNKKAPGRVKKFLPAAKLIIMLMNPIHRAYSWYQHMLAHGDRTAVRHSFFRVVTANNSESDLARLRRRCLDPGRYFEHLQLWVQHFSPNDIILLDSQQLRTDPITLLNGIQSLIPVRNFINYADYIGYNVKKGFFCVKSAVYSDPRCLGKGKGRRYLPMDKRSLDYLSDYYDAHNKKLVQLLQYYGFNALPEWLVSNNI